MRRKSAGSDLVTKDYLDETLDIRFTLFKDDILREVKDMFAESISKLYSRIDPILAEIENHRIDREFTTEKLEDHEKRIKKIERN